MQILGLHASKVYSNSRFYPPKNVPIIIGVISFLFESYMSNLFNSYQSLWKHQRCIKKLESRQVALFPWVTSVG